MPIRLVLPFCNPLISSVDKRDGVEGDLARFYAVGFVRDGSAFLSMIVNQAEFEGDLPARRGSFQILSKNRMARFPEFGSRLRQMFSKRGDEFFRCRQARPKRRI